MTRKVEILEIRINSKSGEYGQYHEINVNKFQEFELLLSIDRNVNKC